MKTKHPMLKSSQLMIVIAITVASVSFVIELGNVGNVMAQADFFAQPIRVHIDKTDHIIGDYGVAIKDLDNGNHVENLYSDSYSSPRNVFIDGKIVVREGDPLQVCVMEMKTEDMACDMQTVHYGQSDTEFFVDMNTATQILQQNNSDNQQNGGGGVDQYNPNPSTNATNAGGNNNSTISGQSNFVPTTMTQISYKQRMTAPPLGANIMHAVGPKVQHLVASTEAGSMVGIPLKSIISVGLPSSDFVTMINSIHLMTTNVVG